MNNPDFHKERSSLQLLGKEFIIVLVVIFSALSFTLGYFVGKSGIDNKPGNPPQAAETMPVPQKQETAAVSQPQNVPATDIKNAPLAEGTAKGPVEAQPKEPIVIVEAKKPETVKGAQPAKEKTPDKPASQQTTKETNKKPEDKDSSASEESRKSDGPTYTVQLAAFRSASEARSFSKKHAKKGLKTYITTSTARNKAKIYKVKSGEFRDRKAAEVMSLKLNKTEKLKTFVTLKSE